MAENLKTVKLNDGTEIPEVINDTTWLNLTTPGLCYYNNEPAYKNIYGALYNWYAANTGKLCPIGWHVPNNDEWSTLLADCDTVGYYGRDEGIDFNSIMKRGFTIVMSGIRGGDGTFDWLGVGAIWWSSTESYRANYAYVTDGGIYNNFMNINDCPKSFGMSIRCKKN